MHYMSELLKTTSANWNNEKKHGQTTPTVVWKAAWHGLASGFAAHGVVNLANTLAPEIPYVKSFSRLNPELVALGAGVAALCAGLFSAQKAYCKESIATGTYSYNLSRSIDDNLQPYDQRTAKAYNDDYDRVAQKRWKQREIDFASAVRWAAVAYFAPTLLKIAQSESPQVITRVCRQILNSHPLAQPTLNFLTNFGAIPGAVLAFSAINVTKTVGPFIVDQPDEKDYLENHRWTRMVWEAPLIVSLTHLALRALEIPVTDSLRDSIKYGALLATAADSFKFLLPTGRTGTLGITLQIHY